MLMKDEWKDKLSKITKEGLSEDEIIILSEIESDFDESHMPNDFEEKYNRVCKMYRERFFGNVVDDQIEDIEKDDDSTEMSFDDLFEEKEGGEGEVK